MTMIDPLPSTDPYGKANWVDYNNNWREADAEWLMRRSILRYTNAAARDADLPVPDAGMITWNEETDTPELRSKTNKWVPVLAAQNIVVAPISDASDTSAVTLRHKGATGGLNLLPDKVAVDRPFEMQSGGLVTGAALKVKTGTKEAALTTDATSLLVDSPVNTQGLVTTTLQATAATVLDGFTATSGTVSGLLAAPGGISLGAMASASGDRAARKDYVDGLINNRYTKAEDDARFIHKTSDTMSGYLQIIPGQDTCLRLCATTPLLEWRNPAVSVRYGYINATAAVMNIVSDTGDITLNSGGGQVRTSDAIYCAGGARLFNSAGQCLALIGTGYRAYTAFYANGGSVDSVGTRSGWMGYSSSGYMTFVNEVSSNSMRFVTDYAFAFENAGHPNVFTIFPGVAIAGKAGSNFDAPGIELFESGTIYTTRSASGGALMYMNRINGVSGNYLIGFYRNGADLGSIRQNGTSSVLYVSNCDYRMKDVLGPITGALARVMKLRPQRAIYHGDEEVVDSFTAHELANVAPYAVSGTKDAVNEEGEPEFQGGDYGRVVPLLTAAIQELADQIESLKRSPAIAT